MKTKQLINLAFISSLLLTAGCSDDQNTETTEINEPVELQISPMVTMTRSVIQGGDQTGNDANDIMKAVAVYAVDKSTSTDYQTGNNYALYTRSGSTWTSGDDKIYLTNNVATVYAYHPAYTPSSSAMQTSGTPLKATNSGSDMTIPVTVLEGTTSTTIAAIDNADMHWSTNTWADNTDANKKKIASAEGEVDYMYATSVEASNGHTSSSTTADAYKKELTMNHALSLLSFRVYNDGTYENTGNLTQIKLTDAKSSGSILSKATNCTMKLADGTIAGRSTTTDESDDATFTRTISGYTLITVGASNTATTVAKTSNATDDNNAAAAASKKVSILVLPTASIGSNEVKATFTIDTATYEISLPTTPNAWVKGTSYLYTVKLSGAGLDITKVTVTDWATGTGGSMDIK